MPYIRAERRVAMNRMMNQLVDAINSDAIDGELTWVISELLIAFYGGSYSSIKDGIGILECAKLEYYRRVAAPYEDGAIKRNGDIYEYPNIRGGQE